MPARKLILGLFTLLLFLPLSKAYATPTATLSATPSATYTLQPLNTDTLLINIVHTFSCITEGIAVDGKPCFESLGPVPLNDNSGGAIGLSKSLILGLFLNPPISTTQYLADVGKSINPIRPVYAQVSGTGGRVIEPVLEIWKLMRNIAYLAMTVVFIIVGFMIMLQRRINPQTVISVQNALPGLIVGLILITFSYFFSALIIDTSFLSANLIGNVLETTTVTNGKITQPLLAPNTTKNILEKRNIIDLFNSFITNADRARLPMENAAKNSLDFLDRGFIRTLVDTALFAVGCGYGYTIAERNIPTLWSALGNGTGTLPYNIGGAIGCVAGGSTLLLTKWFIVGVILYLVLVIMLFIAMFKLTFSLISSYISIIVLTITAPLYFLIGAFPGKGNLAGEWVKSMFAHVLAFPAVFVVFIFAAYIGSTNTSYPPTVDPILGVVPVVNTQQTGGEISEAFKGIAPAGTFNAQFTLPLFAGLPVDLIRLLLAYGILLGSAAVPDAIKQAFGVKGMAAFGQAAAANLGAATTLGPKAGAMGYNRLWRGTVDREGKVMKVGMVQKGYQGIRSRLGFPVR